MNGTQSKKRRKERMISKKLVQKCGLMIEGRHSGQSQPPPSGVSDTSHDWLSDPIIKLVLSVCVAVQLVMYLSLDAGLQETIDVVIRHA